MEPMSKTRRVVGQTIILVVLVGFLVALWMTGMTPARVWNELRDFVDSPECHIDEDCPEPLP